MTLVPSQIDPPIELCTRKRVEIRVFPGRREHDGSIALPDESGQRVDRIAGRERVDQGDAGALAVARDRVIDAEISKQRFWRDSECRTTRDDFRPGRRAAKAVQDVARFRGVVSERDRIAVIDVPNRNSDDVWSKRQSSIARRPDRILREAQIDESHVVPRSVECRRDACQPVGHNGIRLALAIGTHEQHPHSAVGT